MWGSSETQVALPSTERFFFLPGEVETGSYEFPRHGPYSLQTPVTSLGKWQEWSHFLSLKVTVLITLITELSEPWVHNRIFFKYSSSDSWYFSHISLEDHIGKETEQRDSINGVFSLPSEGTFKIQVIKNPWHILLSSHLSAQDRGSPPWVHMKPFLYPHQQLEERAWSCQDRGHSHHPPSPSCFQEYISKCGKHPELLPGSTWAF